MKTSLSAILLVLVTASTKLSHSQFLIDDLIEKRPHTEAEGAVLFDNSIIVIGTMESLEEKVIALPSDVINKGVVEKGGAIGVLRGKLNLHKLLYCSLKFAADGRSGFTEDSPVTVDINVERIFLSDGDEPQLGEFLASSRIPKHKEMIFILGHMGVMDGFKVLSYLEMDREKEIENWLKNRMAKERELIDFFEKRMMKDEGSEDR